MKKEGKLIYGIAICFLAYVVLSWIFPTAAMSSGTVVDGARVPVGLGGLLYYPALTLGTFIQFGLIVLAIGGLYGVMKKSKSYSKLVEYVENKFTNKKKGLLITITIVMAVLSSLTGCPYVLLVLAPFLIDVVVVLGYSKVTALLTSVGAILIGQVGSTFGYTVAGAASTTLGLDIYSGLLPRIILLALVVFIYTLFVLSSANKKAKDETIFYEKETSKDKKVRALPLVVVLVSLVVISLVGMFTWKSVLGVTFFDDIATKITGEDLLNKILGLSAFLGSWDSYELIAVITLSAFVLGWLYNLKLNETLEAFVSGAKKFLKPAFYVTIANVVFTLMLVNQNSNVLVWMLGKINGTNFNIVSVLCSNLLGSLFYNVFPYFFYNVATILATFYGSNYYNILAFVAQGIYGVVMMIIPTSILLVAGLSMTNVSYKEWVKNIWKFLLEILLLVVLVSIILALLIK